MGKMYEVTIIIIHNSDECWKQKPEFECDYKDYNSTTCHVANLYNVSRCLSGTYLDTGFQYTIPNKSV